MIGLGEEIVEAVCGLTVGVDADRDGVDAVFAELARAHVAERGGTTLTIGGEPVRIDDGGELTIGRAGDRRVERRGVSRHHLVVGKSALGLFCYDLFSANGSWLVRDGERTRVDAGGVELLAGDRVVTIGDVELLHVRAVT